MRHTQNGKVLEDKSKALGNRLDMGYDEGQGGTEMTPGLLASAPGPLLLRWEILDKVQVWGGWKGEEIHEFEVPLRCQVLDVCISKSEE